MKILEQILIEIQEWLLTPARWLIDQSIGTEQLESVINMLHLVSSQNSLIDTGNYWAVINSVFSVMRPLGYALITTFFLVSIISLVSRESLTLEGFVKLVIQLIVVITIAGNAELLMNGIFSMGETALNSVSSAVNTSFGVRGDKDSMVYQIVNDLAYDETSGTYSRVLPAILISFIVYLAHQIVIIGIDVAAFSRLLDIGWRAALMPVGIANSFEGGINSAGMRYIKAFAASVFSGVLMLIIASIGFTVAAGVLMGDAGGVTITFEALAVQLATVGACIGAPNKAKELFG